MPLKPLQAAPSARRPEARAARAAGHGERGSGRRRGRRACLAAVGELRPAGVAAPAVAARREHLRARASDCSRVQFACPAFLEGRADPCSRPARRRLVGESSAGAAARWSASSEGGGTREAIVRSTEPAAPAACRRGDGDPERHGGRGRGRDGTSKRSVRLAATRIGARRVARSATMADRNAWQRAHPAAWIRRRPDIRGQRAVHPCGDGLGVETVAARPGRLFAQRPLSRDGAPIARLRRAWSSFTSSSSYRTIGSTSLRTISLRSIGPDLPARIRSSGQPGRRRARPRFAEVPLHGLADLPARPRELARGGRFVLAEHAARLRERELLRVVARRAAAGRAPRARQSPLQPPLQQREVPRPVGIGRRRRGAGHRARLVVFRQRIEAAVRANGVHVPLGEDGPQPRRQAAASVKVAEERPALAVALGRASRDRRRANRPARARGPKGRARRPPGRATGRYSRTKCSHAASSPAAHAQASARSSRCSDFR